MKIKQLTLKDFIGHRTIDMEIDRVVNIVVGPNNSGKTSIADAFEYLFTGLCRGIRKKKDARMLTRNGAKGHSVEATYTHGGEEFTERRTLTKHHPGTQFGFDERHIRAVVGAFRFVEMGAKQRADLISSVCDSSEIEKDVEKMLADCGITKEDLFSAGNLKGVEDLLSDPAKAEKHCIERRKEAKRTIEENTVEMPNSIYQLGDGKELDLSTVMTSDVQRKIAGLERERDEIQKRIGVVEAANPSEIITKLSRVTKTVEGIRKMVGEGDPIETERTLTDKLNRLQAEWEIKKDQLQTLTEMTGHCVAIPDLRCDVNPEDLKAAREKLGAEMGNRKQDLELLRKEVEGIETAAEAKRQLPKHEQDLQDLEEQLGACDDNVDDLRKESESLAIRVDNGRKIMSAVDEYSWLSEEHRINKSKIESATRSVDAWDKAAKLFAQGGPVQEMLAKQFDVARVMRSGETLLPNRSISVGSDWEIALDGTPVELLSRSERFRIGVCFADAITHSTGIGVLFIDEADVLDQNNRNHMMKFLEGVKDDYDSVFVFVTGSRDSVNPSPVEWMQTWWLNGSLEKLS